MPNTNESQFFTQWFPIVPSDVAPIAGPKQSNGQPLPYCKGFHCLTSGNVTARMKDDHANPPQTLPVIAGQLYPYSLSYVYTSTTATLLGLL